MDLEELKARIEKLEKERMSNLINSYNAFSDVLTEFYKKYGVKEIWFDGQDSLLCPMIICKLDKDTFARYFCTVRYMAFEFDETDDNHRAYPTTLTVKKIGVDGDYIYGVDAFNDCNEWNDNDFSNYVLKQIEGERVVPNDDEDIVIKVF